MNQRFSLFTVLAAATFVASPHDQLGILRVTPNRVAEATEEVRVTFDRPVAAGLDETVDPGSFFTIRPAVEGRLQWLDPVTVRFRPAAPLRPSQTYIVTIADNFTAMDGTKLDGPYEFSFRVRGPRTLVAHAIGGTHWKNGLVQVRPDERFDVVLSDPTDPAEIERDSWFVLHRVCEVAGFDRRRFQPGRRIPLRVLRERRVTPEEPAQLRYVGNYGNEAALARHRIVTLTATAPLPPGCPGQLDLPAEFGPGAEPARRQWSFVAHADFRIEATTCPLIRNHCPVGPIEITFSTPVRGRDVGRHVRIVPRLEFSIRDTLDERFSWTLTAHLSPRTAYAVIADTALRDVYGQRLTGNPARGVLSTGFAPAVNYVYGRVLVERAGFRTIAVTHINVDSLRLVVAPVPRALEGRFASTSFWNLGDLWPLVAESAMTRTVPVSRTVDRWVTTGVLLPTHDSRRPDSPTLLAVRVHGFPDGGGNVLVAQVTDLGVHARVGATSAEVWVTGASDGLPRPGAAVALHDNGGRILATATTDARGLARLANFAPDSSDETQQWSWEAEGYVSVALGSDRALTAVSRYDRDLNPWQFNVYPASDEDRHPQTAAVFTERDIYRPGDPVYAKAIIRDGMLGDLRPPARDSVKWIFRDRDGQSLLDTTVTLSEFGTAHRVFTLPGTAALGSYGVTLQRRRDDAWVEVATTTYRVAEYRPPEFLVHVTGDTAARFAGDSLRFEIEARYLFGAPMGRAAFSWSARQRPTTVSGFAIPGAEEFHVGVSGYWWEDDRTPGERVTTTGNDTLDLSGHAAIGVVLPPPPNGRPAVTTVLATVTDVNRQDVTAGASVLVHPAAFYLGAKPLGREYFWRAKRPQEIHVIAVRPGGERVAGIAVAGTIVRREWHRVRRERDGYTTLVGEWVSDTVAACAVTTAPEPVSCGFTPPAGGQYIVHLRAVDPAKRPAITSFYRWATGEDWVPWNDESQFKMDVLPDKSGYTVGDTAEVLFASPFTDAEAWVTVEREGVIEERRLRITSGATTLRFPITEAHVPNAFVSIVVARGRSAPPGASDDPGRPTIRVGYAELRVTPAIKRLTVSVQPAQAVYRPGDSARIRVAARDTDGGGRRAEVTLWAVDQGVLALTGFRTPDPVALIYRPRGLGMRLASNLVAVAHQLNAAGEQTELQKGGEPGGGGGGQGGDILRSQFRATAFFLGAVTTDTNGIATGVAKLPDNLTTFRVMAVAVTAGDRYGSGESELLVTRPLIARPALPRFVRKGDSFSAGVVVNHRLGGTPTVTVETTVRDATLVGPKTQRATLEQGRGSEVRFAFAALPGDSAVFRFDVRSGGEADAVRLALPIRPTYHPRAHTVAGVLLDSAAAEIALPADIDAARSTVTFTLGNSPLAAMRGAFQRHRVYPYHCTEQIVSAALPLIALYRAEQRLPDLDLAPDNAPAHIALAVATIDRRRRPDGGIGYWAPSGWSSPWLTAYAGNVLLAARTIGVAGDDSTLAGITSYLQTFLRKRTRTGMFVARWRDDPVVDLAERLAAAEFLRAAGAPELAAENSLLRAAPQLAWEDRVKLAALLASRGDRDEALRLLEAAWSDVRIEGSRAVLPGSVNREFYFQARTRPMANLLTASMAVTPDHPGIGALVNALIDRGRSEPHTFWNTQDYAFTVLALAAFEARQRAAGSRGIRVHAKNGTKTVGGGDSPARPDAARPFVTEWHEPLAGKLGDAPDGGKVLRLDFAAMGAGPPAYYYVTVDEIPAAPPVRPDNAGIEVDRWYEDYETGEPISRIAAGELARVRLRITVPTTRYFVVLDDALPAGLEAVDLSLRTAGDVPDADQQEREPVSDPEVFGYYGPYWSPFDHREMRDDRVVFYAPVLWRGSYTATYVARATTPGEFVLPPAHAEEMYNPAVHGRSGGGSFTVTEGAR